MVWRDGYGKKPRFERTGVYLLSDAAPGGTGKQHQHGEYFQTACQHVKAQNQLGEGTVAAEITGGTHSFQAGSDVVETGQHRGEIGADGEIIQ